MENECRRKRQLLQRKAVDHDEPTEVPPIVHEVLRSPGQPLDASTRAFFESRFDHSFSQVRVHTDAKAAESAKAVNALAYTVGRDVVFGAGEYYPETMRCTKLLSHELVHVVQQSAANHSIKPCGSVDMGNAVEHEAEIATESLLFGKPPGLLSAESFPRLRRSIRVSKPKDDIPNPGGKGIKQSNAKTIEAYLTTLCPGGGLSVDLNTGTVNIPSDYCTRPSKSIFGITIPWWTTDSPAEQSKTPSGCGCICDLVYTKHKWTVTVDDSKWPQTVFIDPDRAYGLKSGGSGGTVFAPSPNCPKLWGAATASGKKLDIDPWLVLGHELCGHGWLGNFGKHGPDIAKQRGEGGHQLTVELENKLRREHGIDLRGTFKDPNCGESYWRDKKSPGKVNWSLYRDICKKWRERYNAINKKSYTISDRIP